MKLLSEACEYGLRAVVWMAQRPGDVHKVREIAAGTRAAPGYLVKVLQSLSRAGIVSGQRGSSGGFTLKRDPAGITALEVINAVDPIERIRTCPLGIAEHGSHLCPMHRRIDEACAQIEQGFAATTIRELLEGNGDAAALCSVLTVEGSATGGG
ncbi:MAG: Rrf2 family transcriptional regulator [Phycisphaeraceae bacterium]|nr:Rrf2 family transcriptional regulator [Phycisphaeraceae bacterium]